MPTETTHPTRETLANAIQRIEELVAEDDEIIRRHPHTNLPTITHRNGLMEALDILAEEFDEEAVPMNTTACPECKGSGWVRLFGHPGADEPSGSQPAAEGELHALPCLTCHGDGVARFAPPVLDEEPF